MPYLQIFPALAKNIPSSQTQGLSQEMELSILGMTCASCVRRVEQVLGTHPGVESAAVNFATERASVRVDPARVSAADLVQRIRAAGYDALPAPSGAAARVDVAAPDVAGSQVDVAAPDVVASLDPAETASDPRIATERRQRNELIAAASASVPLIVLGMLHGVIPGSDGPLGRALQFVLASFVVWGPGRRFFRLAWIAATHKTSDMNTLVALGAGAAYAYSAVAVLVPSLFPHADHGQLPHVYFEAAGAILTFVQLGKWLEARAKRGLTDAVRRLVALQPRSATRLRGDVHEDVPVDALAAGDVVLVRPGESVPSDGVIVAGESALDESMLTGESIPLDKSAGQPVYGGTLNQSGLLTIRIERTGDDTALSRIVRAVQQAQGSKAPIARLADRVSSIFVPIVLLIASAAFMVWFAVDPSAQGTAVALQHFVAVLVIACPCALGLATPAAVAVGTGRGAELGVLFKGGAVLEEASRIDTVLLDKTGTLTTGKPRLTDVVALEDEATLLSLVAAVEQGSEHPVGRAIVEGAKARGSTLEALEGFRNFAGQGVQGTVSGQLVRVGTAEWLEQWSISTAPLEAAANELANLGRTPSFVSVDERLIGLVAVADRPSDDARTALAALRSAGLQLVMVTGDRKQTARALADELEISEVFAQISPEGKAAVVADARAAGRRVAMVGDGINDAPALATAHVGVALASGSEIAVASGDIALVRGGLSALVRAFSLAHATMRTIRQNLFWAFVYNVAGIPLAAGVLVPWTGWQLSPVLASAAMSLSSVSVLANSLRLKRFGR